MLPITFICPKTGQPFVTDQYDIRDNQGVVIDGQGNKTLEATVIPDTTCPLCGERHLYRAADLPCPFSPRP
jgi:predicted RNA-binding Zn-ribbon protein involved in translation (DUF1610 family)